MLRKPLRGAMLAAVLALLAVIGGPVAAASAQVESSRITAPSNPTYALFDETAPPFQHAFTVSGTTVGAGGNVDVRCYYGAGPKEYATFAENVTPAANAFSIEVSTEELRDGPCVLRAVPAGSTEAHPPGSVAEEATDPFQGPRIAGSDFEIFESNKSLADYGFELNTLSGYFDIEAAGECGLYSRLFAPNTLLASELFFYCSGALYKEAPVAGGAKAIRSELQVDGTNAYDPTAASRLEEELKASIPGSPQLTVSKEFNAASALGAVHETDPIVRCAPEPAVYPPTATSCKEFVSTGVQLERVWQTSHADQVASLTDNWSSTNGAPHTLNALYDQSLFLEEKEGAAFRFPGTSGFTGTAGGQLVGLPSGANAIYYKQDAATGPAGDGVHPQGAIVYDRAPGESLSFVSGSHEKGKNYTEFEMPYQATVPASGTYTLAMTFVQAYALAEVETLAGEALASYQSPSLAIGSPASGATVSTPSVTVTGTATEPAGGTPSLTVAGHAVSVGANGAWSTSVALSRGANTITAVASDALGLTSEKSIVVTYSPPPPPVAHAHQVGVVSAANGEVKFTLACVGTAGTGCEVESTLTTVLRTRGGQPIAVSARRHHRRRARSQRVTVGSSKVTIPAGERVTIVIGLNPTGRQLLAHFGHLPGQLTVLQLSGGHRSTVIAQNLVVTPHRARHHRHHRHHRR